MSEGERHACPRCGALGPCDPQRCATGHGCAECGKTWVRYVFADLDPMTESDLSRGGA